MFDSSSLNHLEHGQRWGRQGKRGRNVLDNWHPAYGGFIPYLQMHARAAIKGWMAQGVHMHGIKAISS